MGLRIVLAVGVVLVALAVALWQRSDEPLGQAPDFVLPDLGGKAVRLSQLKGKVVFLNVWATWCPPCRKEMPTMETLYQKLKGTDFVMLAVSEDADGLKTVVPYVNEGAYTFPVLLDTAGEVHAKFGVTGFPETFIINREGRVVHHHIGYQDWSGSGVERALRTLMSEGAWTGWKGSETAGEARPAQGAGPPSAAARQRVRRARAA